MNARTASIPLPRLDHGIDHLTQMAPHARGIPTPGFSRILLADDGSSSAAAGVQWAAALARAYDAQITVATVVVPPYPIDADAPTKLWLPAEPEYRRAQADLQDSMERTLSGLRSAGVRARGNLLVGNAVDSLSAEAERSRADLVVIGTHGRGALGRALLGSTSDRVKDRVRSSVLIARAPAPPVDILSAVDGSAQSRAAAATAADLARLWSRHAAIVHVVEPWTDRKPLAPLPRETQEARVAYLRAFGDPAERIVETATSRRSGLIVMGSRGAGRLGALVMGSVSAAVCHRAPCSVLVMRDEIG